jgi:hypothetical protein
VIAGKVWWFVGRKKLNDFSYVLNEEGQLDYVLVDIISPKHGLKQMKLDLDCVDFLKDGTISLRKQRDDFYATQWVDGKYVKFHRRVFPDIKQNEVVDHISGNTLDNRRSQLSAGTHRDNVRNTKRNRNGGLYGSCFCKRDKKWRARITVNKKHIFLGYFKTAEEAHAAVLEYEKTNNII